ncbi:hypothetical protein D3C77_48710 [compost metagenome]
MSKTREFELLGALIGHPDYPNAARGDVLKLEVGSDDLPTSDLLRSRVRPLGERLAAEGEAMTDKEAKGKAKEILDDAKAKAADIIGKAETDAKAITDKATADAQALLDSVKS